MFKNIIVAKNVRVWNDKSLEINREENFEITKVNKISLRLFQRIIGINGKRFVHGERIEKSIYDLKFINNIFMCTRIHVQKDNIS